MSYADGRKLEKKAGYESKLRYLTDKNKSASAGQQYRYGYRRFTRAIPAEKLRQLGIPPLNSFAKDNGHNAEIWGWKRECTMTDRKAWEVMLECILSAKLTLPMLGAVRKSLAYTYQLMGNPVTKEQDNWREGGRAWKTASKERCVPTTSTKPTCIPTPTQLRELFRTRWSRERNKVSFLKSVLSRRASIDIFWCGNRPNEDCGKRLKESRKHYFNLEAGYHWTDYKGGRAKLSGPKKNSRKWKQYTPCWCSDGKHISPTLRDRHNIDSDGNPIKPIGWDDRCVIAGL